MPEAFSFNREFDFVRMDGLRRATGRPAHEWDLYILKELLDNALDADEALWNKDLAQFPQIDVHIEYLAIPDPPSRPLFVQVGNRAVFDDTKIDDIFATGWYTSRKAFLKGLTRGALGNALKTILGIPYALRNRVAGDWRPGLKPLSICCGTTEYRPRYVIDSTAQTIRSECAPVPARAVAGTLIRVGLDHFEQEQPRTLEQVVALARQYHLCNPHARFRWTIEIGGRSWPLFEHQADQGWANKFRDDAPIQWYAPAAFQHLLGALHREHCSGDPACALPVSVVCEQFAGAAPNGGADAPSIPSGPVIAAFGCDSLSVAGIDGPDANDLYKELYSFRPRFESATLGGIGPEHIRRALSAPLLGEGMPADLPPIEGELFYEASTDPGDDPTIPFVIEAAAARLKEGKRQVWTAINFAPTYGDPFLRRWLRAPIQPNAPALGLRGLLDAYSLPDDTPMLLFLHIICPNVEHDDFSKTEINHLPFRQTLGDVLDRLLTRLKQAHEETELQLQQAVFRALEDILSELGQNERFVFDQLLARLRVRLSRNPALATWLDRPDAASRLQRQIASYQSRTPVLAQRVARPAADTLSIPLHPDRYFTLSTEQIARDLLDRNHVNKLLYIQMRELEPVALENRWLPLMDLALIHSSSSTGGLRDALLRCAAGCDLPIMILHDANEAGRELVRQARAWLDDGGFISTRVVDLGLEMESGVNEQARLVDLMPGELAARLLERFAALSIPVKSLPDDRHIRQGIRDAFTHLLLGHIWEDTARQLELTTRLLDDLDRQVGFTEAMQGHALDTHLKQRMQRQACDLSYTSVLDETVQAFFKSFMREHGAAIEWIIREHVAQVRERYDR